MNFLDALRTSSSGLTAQRTRMDLISGNLANLNTTRTDGGGPYKRKDAVFEAIPIEKNFQSHFKSAVDRVASEVKVVEIVEDQAKPLSKYDPSNPESDENGYVAMPNINVIEEMVNMMLASRSYEANVAAINATKKMALKALEIGK
jgi:flagellar basal-body rod protein FlgC